MDVKSQFNIEFRTICWWNISPLLRSYLILYVIYFRQYSCSNALNPVHHLED